MLFTTSAIPKSAAPANPVAGALSGYESQNLTQAAGVCTGWTDSGSNGFNLTATNSPVYNATALNGKPGAQLVGASSQRFDNGNSASFFMPSAGFDAFVVMMMSAVPGAGGGPFGSNTLLLPTVTYPTNVTAKGTGNDGATKSTGAVAVVLSTFYLAHLYYDGVNLNMRINGVDATPVAMGAYTGTGNIFRIGDNNGAHMTGTLCELWFYSTLSGANRLLQRAYLANKFAVTA